MQQASRMEGELGKLKDTSPEAAEMMLKLVDLYHEHAGTFGLIRVGQRFASNHPAHARHAEAMLKLLDGLEAASRNKETVAFCRQFLLRYATHPGCQKVEELLARTLDMMPDRAAAADANAAVWRRQPTTELGRRSLVRAITQYGEANSQPAFTKAAELAEAALDRYPPGDFSAGVGGQAVYNWDRLGQYAKSNQAALKLLAKGLPRDPEALRQLHLSMGENYARLNQRTNAADSFAKARAMKDSAYLLSRIGGELYSAGAKAPQLQAIVNEFFQKYPTHPDRFALRSYLAIVHSRDNQRDAGVAIARELLPFDARSNSMASFYVQQIPQQPAQFAQAEQALIDAINRNPRDANYLRYVLMFELYRDRMKDLAKARQVARDLIAKSPSNDGHTQAAIHWLLFNPSADAEFAADLERVIEARKQNAYWDGLRAYLPQWIDQAKTTKGIEARASLAAQRMAASEADGFIADWIAIETPGTPKYEPAVQRLLVAFAKLTEDQARSFVNRVGQYYLNYGSNEQRARSVTIFAQLADRFPKDYMAAYYRLFSAVTYGTDDQTKQALAHVLKIDPQANDNNFEIWYRLAMGAARVKDPATMKLAHAWTRRCQDGFGNDMRYSDSIGDYLMQLGLKQEAVDYWRRQMALDYNNYYSRSCAGRILATLEGPAKLKFIQDMMAVPKGDFHGVYAMWLAEHYLTLMVPDLANFQKTLVDSRTIQRERSFRAWGIEEYPVGQWIAKYRNDEKAKEADKRLVYTTIRDLDMGRASAAAQVALLELPLPATEKRTEMERLLAYQRATTMLWVSATDWDWLIAYAQAAMARKDYAAVAALTSGMLENMRDAGPDRLKLGREMVAQSYARMGAVGLAIDENSPTAPLLQAALYLRLGDRRLALDTYLANKELFAKHRDELPVDLILFVCDSLIAAGSEENHERVEGILRGWLVKFSEAKDLDAATKASVQLLLAKNFFKAQRFDVARSEYQTVKNLYPDTPAAIDAEFGVGETFLAQKDYSNAETVFDGLARSRERDVVIRAQFLRGVLYSRKGDREEARNVFRGVLDMVPNIEVANETLYYLSEVYGAEERYMDQLELLRTVGRLGRRSKRWHTPGTSLSIVVYDPDLGTSRQHGRIPVKISTVPGGDEELLYLYTTSGGGKGLFRADLETRLGQRVKGDKVLQITGRDTIRVDYPDEFKAEFKSVPLSDAEIRIASNGKLEVSSGKIIDAEKETLSERLAREEREADRTAQRLALGRPTNQIKPGNPIYLRVQDPDRDLSLGSDKVIIKLTAASGDQVSIELMETGPHTGVFEGQAQTGELPAGALSSDTAIDHSPLMAIDQDPATYWLSQPDGATPKWLAVDMKDLKTIDRASFATPNPKSQAPVRGTLQGSHDGRFWFRIASVPAQPPVPAVATESGQMKLRLYQGDYIGYSNWQQIIELAKTKPQIEKEVETLSWNVPESDPTAKTARAAIWHGKFFVDRSRGVRFSVSAEASAIVVDGQLELPVGQGDGRTVDVWLDKGTHDLTIFAATRNPVQGLTALRAPEDPNSAEVVLAPFRAADFDLKAPGAKPAELRRPAVVATDKGVWDFQFSPYELRHVKLVAQEYTGEALAISHVQISGEKDGAIIPTKADILKLASNNILEIAAGDVITASYTDEFTQNSDGASQLLTAQLQATYFNAYITPIIYDLVRQRDGAVSEIRKQLKRIDPGEKFIIEVVDYDQDTSPEPDKLKIRVAVNDGQPIELVAQETGPGTGIFVKEVFTAAKPEDAKPAEGILAVKVGDRIVCSYVDTQNTFPGHPVPRETIVLANEPTEGKIRVVETRFIRGEEDPQSPGSRTPPRVIYLPGDGAAKTAKVAFEVPLTVEVYDRDAAKDSGSKVVVQLTTTDGAKVDVECVVSPQFASATQAPTLWAETWALEEGRFIGQVILQLGSKASPSLVPLTSDMPRDLIGGAALTEEERGKGGALITRVLNLTGKDVITAAYKDQRRPAGEPQILQAQGRLIANATLLCTDREYDRSVQKLHVGEKMYLRVVDADLDSSDERDVALVQITTPRGEKEVLPLLETLAHSGVFTGSVTLKPADKPVPGNLKADDPVIETFFGDTIKLEYLDKAASTESGELLLSIDLPVVIGTDGLVAAFSKTFHDEKLAVETQFHIAESYFELFKSHRKLGRQTEEREDLESGRRILREVMEDYPNPKYAPRIAYLLGQFAQELQQWHEAIDAYRLIVRKYPEHTLAADAQFKMAQCYEESKEFNQALEEYVTLAATYPKSPLIANVMVRIMDHFYSNTDKPDNFEIAAQVGKKFLEKFEGHEWAPKVAFRIGQAYYKSKKYPEAGKAFDDFAKVFPDNALAPDAVFWSGESFREGKNNADAYKRYQMCRWKYPSSEASKFALGRLSLPEMIAQLEADARALDNNN